jgi:hypothetical protein
VASAARAEGARLASVTLVGIGVVDAPLLEKVASLTTELGEALLDSLWSGPLRERTGNGLVLFAGDIAPQAEDEELAVVVGVPLHSTLPTPGAVWVDETTARTSVGVCRSLDVGVIGVWKS